MNAMFLLEIHWLRSTAGCRGIFLLMSKRRFGETTICPITSQGTQAVRLWARKSLQYRSKLKGENGCRRTENSSCKQCRREINAVMFAIKHVGGMCRKGGLHISPLTEILLRQCISYDGQRRFCTLAQRVMSMMNS